MKRLLIFLAACVISLTAIAQDKTAPTYWNQLGFDSIDVDQAGTELSFYIKYGGTGTQFVFTISQPPLALDGFFVDATGGNDSDDGLTPATAWKTIAKVNSQTLVAGETVYFKRGETWTGEELTMGESGDYLNPITFSAYGTGAKPIITVRKSLIGWTTPGNWANLSGDVWYMTGNSNPRRVWVDGQERKEPKNLENTGADNTGYVSDLSAEYPFMWKDKPTDTLYYNSPSGNPASNFTTMEQLDMSNSALTGNNIDNIKIEYLDLRGGNYTVRVNGGDNWYFDSCDIGKDGFYGLRFDGASYTSVDTMTVENCEFDANDTLWYTTHNNENVEDAIWLAGPADSIIVRGSTFRNFSHDGFNLYSQIGDTSDMYADIYVYENFFTAPDVTYGRAIDVQSTITSSDNINIYNNYIYNMPIGNQIISSHTKFYNNIIDSIRGDVYGIMSAYAVEGGGVGMSPYRGGQIYNTWLYNNIIMKCAEWPIDIRGRTDRATSKIYGCRIENNILAYSHYDETGYTAFHYNTGAHEQLRVTDDGDNDNVFGNFFNNNIFFDTSAVVGTELINYQRGASDEEFTVTEFNAFDGTASDDINDNFGTDPELVAPGYASPLGTNYQSYTTSDGNAGGIAVAGYDLDKDGVSVGIPPNISPYEGLVTAYFIPKHLQERFLAEMKVILNNK